MEFDSLLGKWFDDKFKDMNRVLNVAYDYLSKFSDRNDTSNQFYPLWIFKQLFIRNIPLYYVPKQPKSDVFVLYIKDKINQGLNDATLNMLWIYYSFLQEQINKEIISKYDGKIPVQIYFESNILAFQKYNELDASYPKAISYIAATLSDYVGQHEIDEWTIMHSIDILFPDDFLNYPHYDKPIHEYITEDNLNAEFKRYNILLSRKNQANLLKKINLILSDTETYPKDIKYRIGFFSM